MPHEAAVLIGLGQSGMPVEVTLDRGWLRPKPLISQSSEARLAAMAAHTRDIR